MHCLCVERRNKGIKKEKKMALTVLFYVEPCAVVEHAVVVRRKDVDGGVEARAEHRQPQGEPDHSDDEASQPEVDAPATPVHRLNGCDAAHVLSHQGDRIGRIFATWAIIFFGHFFENNKRSPNF
jgi:hypothetical protein